MEGFKPGNRDTKQLHVRDTCQGTGQKAVQSPCEGTAETQRPQKVPVTASRFLNHMWVLYHLVFKTQPQTLPLAHYLWPPQAVQGKLALFKAPFRLSCGVCPQPSAQREPGQWGQPRAAPPPPLTAANAAGRAPSAAPAGGAPARPWPLRDPAGDEERGAWCSHLSTAGAQG